MELEKYETSQHDPTLYSIVFHANYYLGLFYFLLINNMTINFIEGIMLFYLTHMQCFVLFLFQTNY